MYYLIENGKIVSSSDTYISSSTTQTIKKDFSLEELEKIKNGYSYNLETEELEETEESIQKEKELAKQQAYNTFNNTLAVITSNYSDNERASFELKRQEAEKVIAGGESVFLEALVLEGETVLELANKIIANSQAYQLLYANAERKLREDLKNI